MEQNETKKLRILTGDRPTGRMHLGHFVGSMQNRVALQHEYDTFILIADVQGLTTHFEHPELIRDSIYQVTLDNLSVGLDPNIVTFVQQSQIAAIAELTEFYSLITSVNTLRHNPTIKTEAKQYGYTDLMLGFLSYPVSQAADITFCNANLVPVGEDNAPLIELTRKIARKFNDMYGEVITVPELRLSKFPRLPGLDGNSKMGKSLGNAIYLSDDRKTVEDKVRSALTDPGRIKATDPGNPDICMVAKYHQIFNADQYAEIDSLCRGGGIGCVACKKRLAARLNDMLDPFREKRAYYESHIDQVTEIIMAGSAKANKVGDETVHRVKKAMHLLLE